jgi:hypothetical protein
MSNPFSAGYKEPKQASKYLKFTDEGSYLFRILTPKTEVITYFSEFIEDNDGKNKKIVYEDMDDIPKMKKEGMLVRLWNPEKKKEENHILVPMAETVLRQVAFPQMVETVSKE